MQVEARKLKPKTKYYYQFRYRQNDRTALVRTTARRGPLTLLFCCLCTAGTCSAYRWDEPCTERPGNTPGMCYKQPFQFHVIAQVYSPIGRTQTLPRPDDENYRRVRIAHFSCSNFVRISTHFWLKPGTC